MTYGRQHLMKAGLAALMMVAACSSCRENSTTPSQPRSTTATPAVMATTTRPNIVLILADDQRYGTMNWLPLTSAIMANAVTFTQAIANSPICCPMRATILTGQYVHNHGVMSSSIVQPHGGAPAYHRYGQDLPAWMQAAGYHTGMFGKYLNGWQTKGSYVPPGWDDFRVFKQPGYVNYYLMENGVQHRYNTLAADYSTTRLAAQAVSFINPAPANQPVFLYYAPYGPHEPSTPAAVDQKTCSTVKPYRSPAYNEADVSDKPAWIQALPSLTGTAVGSTTDALNRKQCQALQAVDRGVRDIWQALQNTGRASNTYFVYLSDNGLSLGDHRHPYKNCAYESCIRVPLLIMGPGITPRTDSSLVMLEDLAPTFLEWAGAPAETVNGTSLATLLTTPGTPWRDAVLLEVLEHDDYNSKEGLFSGIRTARYTYIEDQTGEVELYDLQSDPFQLTNAAQVSSNQPLVAQLSAQLAQLKAQ